MYAIRYRSLIRELKILAITVYGIIFTASIICSAIYIFNWHKHFNTNIGMIFAFIPITCLGHLMFSMSESLGEAVAAQRIIYLGSSFLQLFFLLSVFNICKTDLRNGVRVLLYLICAGAFMCAFTIGKNDLFYRDISFEIVDGTAVLSRQYGPLHTLFYAVVLVFFAIGFYVILYSRFRKRQVPRRIIGLLVLPYMIVLVSYFVLKKIIYGIDLMPLGYLMAQIIYIIISARVNLYDVADTAIDSMVRQKAIGYISFDFKYRYLGSNEVARMLVPALNDLAVDDVFGSRDGEGKIRHYLDRFSRHPSNNSFLYTYLPPDCEGPSDSDSKKIYDVKVNYLYDGSHRRGFIVTFTDDTANKKYIKLLDGYNEKLKDEVKQKTRHIVEMHDNLIMSLAMMVESRDNSTGGHIRRTSECVRILVDEIKKEGRLSLSDEFCEDLIKAAPMHDLGKIAVDDAVLRKAGRFTDEEYNEMKKHAAEGARVIHEILLNTDDESFKKIAENVAHYHHERYDGSGYPEKLVGEDIPLEARIMAVADVYDALVSKRVYKEAFSFEKADRIIMEGMGTQFDPALKEVYERSRPRLEDYYRKEQE